MDVSEIKFKVDSLDDVRRAANQEALTDEWRDSDNGYAVRQKDTYFHQNFADSGRRMKLTEFLTVIPGDPQRRMEVLDYLRPDHPPSMHTFTRDEVAVEAGKVPHINFHDATVMSVVEKTREVIVLGRTRVCLTTITELGDHFVEIEVMLLKGESIEDGHKEAVRIAAQLGITQTPLEADEYLKMLPPAVPRRMQT